MCSIRRIRKTVEIKEVTLLLEDISFTLPFPHEQLTVFFATKSDPLSAVIKCYAVNLILSYLEALQRLQSVQIIDRKHAIGLADDEHTSRIRLF